MKKLLLVALVGLLLASCEKDENVASDFIVKEYDDDYVLDFWDDRGTRLSDNPFLELGVSIDINDDNVDDVMVCLSQVSGAECLTCIPLSSNVILGGLYPNYLHYGNFICDTTSWEKERTFWSYPFTKSEKYLAVKFETDTSVNYGWMLSLIEPHHTYELDYHNTISIVKTAYCKTNGKAIFAGQEE